MSLGWVALVIMCYSKQLPLRPLVDPANDGKLARPGNLFSNLKLILIPFFLNLLLFLFLILNLF